MPILFFKTRVTKQEKRRLDRSNALIVLTVLPLFIVMALAFGLPKIGLSLPYHDQLLGVSGFLSIIGFFIGVALKMITRLAIVGRKMGDLKKSRK